MLKRTMTLAVLGLALSANGAYAVGGSVFDEPYWQSNSRWPNPQVNVGSAAKEPQVKRPSADSSRAVSATRPSNRDSLFGVDPKNPYHDVTNHSY